MCRVAFLLGGRMQRFLAISIVVVAKGERLLRGDKDRDGVVRIAYLNGVNDVFCTLNGYDLLNV